MSSSRNSRFGRCDDSDSNRPHKKPRYSIPTERYMYDVIENDADSSINKIPESDKWVATRFLGSGSYGSVHYAVSNDVSTIDEEIVVKSNEISKASRLIKEEEFLTRLNSPFVVSCYGHEINGNYYNLLLEYCPGQCLEKYIQSRIGGLAEAVVKRLAVEILVGLKYIHGMKIIHSDIKPKNILLAAENVNDENKPFRAKISGFGKAIEKRSVVYEGLWGRHRKRGTKRFMSPEIVNEGDVVLDYEADVWAFGCTVLEMLTGERVWGQHGSEFDWEDWITLIGESGLVPHVPRSLSEEAKDFLSKCLERDPSLRWSVDSLLNHRFLSWKHEDPEEEEEEEEEIEDVEAELVYLEEEEDEEEEEVGDVEAEEAYLEEDEIEDAEVEAYEDFEEEEEEVYEEEAIEIDEEYPKQEDSDEDP